MHILKRTKRDFNKKLLKATSIVAVGAFLFNLAPQGHVQTQKCPPKLKCESYLSEGGQVDIQNHKRYKGILRPAALAERITGTELRQEINNHNTKNGEEKEFLRSLEADELYIRHEIKRKKRDIISTEGRTFSRVYRIRGTQLVEKCLRNGLDIKTQAITLQLAQERLRGLAAKTYIYHHRVIQEYVEPLIFLKEKQGYLFQIPESEAKKYIDKYLEAILKIWRRGVFDIDPGMQNFGVNLSGDVVCFDFDLMQAEEPGVWAMGNLELNTLLKVIRENTSRLPPALRGYYRVKIAYFETAARKEFGGAAGYTYWRKDIEEGLIPGHLGFPHPYPLQKLQEWKRQVERQLKGHVQIIPLTKENVALYAEDLAEVDRTRGDEFGESFWDAARFMEDARVFTGTNLDGKWEYSEAVIVGDKAIGYLIGIRGGVKDFGVPDDARHLLRIAIAPRYRNLNIGARLIRNLALKVHGEGVRYIYVDVNSKRTDALKFYKRCGFEEISRQPYDQNEKLIEIRMRAGVENLLANLSFIEARMPIALPKDIRVAEYCILRPRAMGERKAGLPTTAIQAANLPLPEALIQVARSGFRDFSPLTRLASQSTNPENQQKWLAMVHDIETQYAANSIEGPYAEALKARQLVHEINQRWFLKRGGLLCISSAINLSNLENFFNALTAAPILYSNSYPVNLRHEQVGFYILDLANPPEGFDAALYDKAEGSVIFTPSTFSNYIDWHMILRDNLDLVSVCPQDLVRTYTALYTALEQRFNPNDLWPAYFHAILMEEFRHAVDHKEVDSRDHKHYSLATPEFRTFFVNTHIVPAHVLYKVWEKETDPTGRKGVLAETYSELTAQLTAAAVGKDPLLTVFRWVKILLMIQIGARPVDVYTTVAYMGIWLIGDEVGISRQPLNETNYDDPDVDNITQIVQGLIQMKPKDLRLRIKQLSERLMVIPVDSEPFPRIDVDGSLTARAGFSLPSIDLIKQYSRNQSPATMAEPVPSPIESNASLASILRPRAMGEKEMEECQDIGVSGMKNLDYFNASRWVKRLSKSDLIILMSSSILANLPFIFIRSLFTIDMLTFNIVMSSVFFATMPIVVSTFSLKAACPSLMTLISVYIFSRITANSLPLLNSSDLFIFLSFITKIILEQSFNFVNVNLKL